MSEGPYARVLSAFRTAADGRLSKRLGCGSEMMRNATSRHPFDTRHIVGAYPAILSLERRRL
jgi:hypothetical protein